jgi:hypothetical protein
MELLHEVIAARFPDDVLDLLFTISAQVFSEASPMEACEAALQVAADPVFGCLNFSSADNTGVHFQLKNPDKFPDGC